MPAHNAVARPVEFITGLPVPPVIVVLNEPDAVEPQARSLTVFDTAVKAEAVTLIVNVEVAVKPPASVTVKVMVLVPV